MPVAFWNPVDMNREINAALSADGYNGKLTDIIHQETKRYGPGVIETTIVYKTHSDN